MTSSWDAETKQLFNDTLLRFLKEHYGSGFQRGSQQKTDIDREHRWRVLAELGLLGLPFAESLGGLGGSVTDCHDVLEVLATGLIVEPFVDSIVVAGSLLAQGIEPHDVVRNLIGGKSVEVLLDGWSGSTGAVSCNLDDKGYRLNGKMLAVPFADEADVWLLSASDADGIPHVFRVRRVDTRATVSAYRLMDGRPAADICFSESYVHGGDLWLKQDAAAIALRRTAERAVESYCADAVGVMGFLVKVTGEYLRTRTQFGVNIGSFQALQHRFADMYMAYVEAQAISRSLANQIDLSAFDQQRAWIAYSAASVVLRAAKLIGHEAIQMHGGMGVTEELIVGHGNARLVVLSRFLSNWMASQSPLAFGPLQ